MPEENKVTAPAPTKTDKSGVSVTSFDPKTGIVTVSTTDPDTGKSATIKYLLGKTIEEAATKLTGPVALEKLSREISRNLSNNGRARLKAGKTPAEVESELAAWTPGMSTPRAAKIPALQALAAELSAMTPEQMQAKIAELTALAKARKG